jgi:hypothetical protein
MPTQQNKDRAYVSICIHSLPQENETRTQAFKRAQAKAIEDLQQQLEVATSLDFGGFKDLEHEYNNRKR